MQRLDQRGGVVAHPPDGQLARPHGRAADALVVEDDDPPTLGGEAFDEGGLPRVDRARQPHDQHDRGPVPLER